MGLKVKTTQNLLKKVSLHSTVTPSSHPPTLKATNLTYFCSILPAMLFAQMCEYFLISPLLCYTRGGIK